MLVSCQNLNVLRVDLYCLHEELFQYAPNDREILLRLLVYAGDKTQQWIVSRSLMIFRLPYHYSIEDLTAEVKML
jgi:hypothetical protein